LKVGEAKQRDIGKRRARMGASIMEHLNVSAGDTIEITGAALSCAVVWPADEDDEGMIRIDSQTRKNAGVALNDTVMVRKTASRIAKTLVLAPVDNAVSADKEFTSFVKNRLKGMPLSYGDEISVMNLGNSIDFKVTKMLPRGVASMNDSTALTILADAVHEKKPRITYEEVGGLAEEIKAMREIVELPLRHPEIFGRLGVEAHGGILLYGPPGCGKTLIAKVLANESEASMYAINGPEIMNKYYGETEARLRGIFKEARENAPSIIFIDEIDAIAPKREDVHGDVEKRVVAQLLALMDGLTERGSVMVLGATNRLDSVDPALRRPGRFDREVEVSVPNYEGRLEILQIHTRGMPIPGLNLEELASDLHGYTGADIKSLCREAAMKAIRRYLPQMDLESERIPSNVLESMEVTLDDFYDGMHEVVPTVMRQFYVERPRVWWRDVGGMDDAKQTLQDNIISAMCKPEKFHKMGIRPPRGVLIYGPPGCGKTLLARALASESGGNMIMVRGPEILSRWVGESEKAVREIFRKAKSSSPCIVIFDEIDSLARAKTGSAGDSGNTILSQILTEIEDGVSSRVAVVGITNRPDLLDGALLRAGRLDLKMYVPPPLEDGRLEIIRILTQKMPLDSDVSLQEIAVTTKNYTGADIAALCREAAVSAMRDGRAKIASADFAHAIERVSPTMTDEMSEWYAAIDKSMTNVIPKPIDRAFYG